MTRYLAFATSLAASFGLVTGCTTSPAPPGQQVADTHESMVRWINPASLALWDVTNQAVGDDGGLDPALLDAAAWSKLREAAQTLETHSRHLAEAQVLHVGAHNDALEGFATRAEIQAMIDADPEGFRALARETAEHAAGIVQASAARDAATAGSLAETLSERCSACHTRYWEKPA